MKSRNFTIVDVPESSNVEANFVYNFFTPDERTNDSGELKLEGLKPEDLQKQIDKKTLNLKVPRFIEVSFAKVETFGYLQNSKTNTLPDSSKFNFEETITNIGFASLRESDSEAVSRLEQKISALSKISGISFEDSEQSKKISQMLGVSQDDVQSIISPLNDEKFLVNEVKTARPASVFDIASSFKIVSQINKRLAGACVNSADDTSPLSKPGITIDADKVSKIFLSKVDKQIITEEDIRPVVIPFDMKEVPNTNSEKIESIVSIGYLITRHRYGPDGKRDQTKNYFLQGPESTKYIDTSILYGSSYLYEVRAAYEVSVISEVHFPLQDVPVAKYDMKFIVMSRPAMSGKVRTEEFQPPNEPDGVLYQFNYEKERGLVIRWQIPTGRSRDTKYFQIFRRKSIFEPFVCIGMIDFDDSEIRSVIPEQVKPQKIYSYERGIRTFFEDPDFERTSKFIYSVAAIDAHGMTSGYSVQTEVSFDRVKNLLTLKRISRGGAPKQYPNFYVDPDLDENIAVDSFTQDAIFDSGHKKMTIFFTPDARIAKTSDKGFENVFFTNQQQGSYSFHFINLDVQSSQTVSIGVTDLRKL